MSTYAKLPLIQTDSYFGSADDDTMVAEGIRATTLNTSARKHYSYDYAVYNIATFDGNDVVYLSNVTSIDPAGINPRARQTIDLGVGDDFARVASLGAATIFAGDGNDRIIKVDLRSESASSSRWRTAQVRSSLSTDGRTGCSRIPCGSISISSMAAPATTSSRWGNGPDWIYGGSGADVISLGERANVAFAGDGDDTIIVEGLSYNYVTSHLPPMSSSLYAFSTNAIWAGDGDDAISIRWVQNGLALVAAVNGEGGDDTITVLTASASWITGGDGDDTVLLRGDFLSYAYNVVFAQPNDAIWGDRGDDTLYAELGDDTIVGGEGRDWIFGGYGNDFLYGGVGGGVADAETDRFSLTDYSHRDFASYFIFPEIQDIDRVYDFQPASRFVNPVGASDVIDVAAMFNEKSSDPLTYGAANPFTDGQLRLLDSGAGHVCPGDGRRRRLDDVSHSVRRPCERTRRRAGSQCLRRSSPRNPAATFSGSPAEAGRRAKGSPLHSVEHDLTGKATFAFPDHGSGAWNGCDVAKRVGRSPEFRRNRQRRHRNRRGASRALQPNRPRPRKCESASASSSERTTVAQQSSGSRVARQCAASRAFTRAATASRVARESTRSSRNAAGS